MRGRARAGRLPPVIEHQPESDNSDLIRLPWRPLMLPPSSLRSTDRKTRTHSKAQIQRIADSILQLGFINPVVIDRRGKIIAGYGRFEAAKLPPAANPGYPGRAPVRGSTPGIQPVRQQAGREGGLGPGSTRGRAGRAAGSAARSWPGPGRYGL